MNPLEQYVDEQTDTIIYSINKITKLLISCNPNTIEILGCKPEHYLMLDKTGKMLLVNRKLFLSKRAIGSFSGYAGQQLNRMLNALARDSYKQAEKEEHILRSIKNAIASFNERYTAFDSGSINLYIGESKKEGLDTEIFADIHLHNYPLRDFNGMLNELGAITKTYGKINHKNNKKDDAHLNKHAMHLVRLYLMCFDILENGEIITYREKDQDLLMDIRNGKYQNEDHTYRSEFFELINDLSKRAEYDARNTSLPDTPDLDAIEEMVMEINTKTLNRRRKNNNVY